jgi:hypothetical protein
LACLRRKSLLAKMLPIFAATDPPIGECHAGLAAPALSRNTPKGQAGSDKEGHEAGL